MKKIIIICISGLSLLLLTACGQTQENLNCSLKQGNKLINYEITFNGNDIISYKYSEEEIFDSIDQAQLVYKQLETTFSIFDAYSAITTEKNINEKKVTSSMTVNFDDLTAEEKKNLSFDFETAEDFKKMVNAQGFKCN